MTSVTGYSDLFGETGGNGAGVQPELPHVAHRPGAQRIFLRSPVNEAALKILEVWRADTSSGNSGGVLIAGPQGAGKSYLARYVVAPLPHIFLTGKKPEALFGTMTEECVPVFDDADYVADPDILLRFVNQRLEEGRPFMVIGRGRPRDWARRGDQILTDLETRLSALPTASLEKPDAALLTDAMIHLLAERQIRIDRNVANVAAAGLKRSFTALSAFIEKLDETAMQRQKSIDRTFVQAILKSMPEHALS